MFSGGYVWLFFAVLFDLGILVLGVSFGLYVRLRHKDWMGWAMVVGAGLWGIWLLVRYKEVSDACQTPGTMYQ